MVTNTNDSGPGSLRQAILDANAHSGPTTSSSTSPPRRTPISTCRSPGFDPVTQTWTISLQSPLPAITDPVTIDGYTQAHSRVPFRYPNAFSSSQVMRGDTGVPTGGASP